MSASAIANSIIAETIKTAGSAWTGIKQAAPLYIKGYAQTLVDIAKGVARGEITPADAKMYVSNAKLLLAMGIANVTQVVLARIQGLIDNVMKTLKTAINGMLPIAIL